MISGFLPPKKDSTQRKVAILVLSTICLSLLGTHLYSIYYSPSDTDILPQNLSFAMSDQEVQVIQKKFLSLTFTSPTFLMPFLLIEMGFFAFKRTSVWEKIFPNRDFSIARC
jgi:hypothetical protein